MSNEERKPRTPQEMIDYLRREPDLFEKKNLELEKVADRVLAVVGSLTIKDAVHVAARVLERIAM